MGCKTPEGKRPYRWVRNVMSAGLLVAAIFSAIAVTAAFGVAAAFVTGLHP